MTEEFPTYENIVSSKNPFEGNEDLWNKWEKECKVPPVRVALVHLNKPYDLAQAAQISLSSTVDVPHISFEMIGTTMDFSNKKISDKIRSWNIPTEFIESIPRRMNSLENLKRQGFRLVGTVAKDGENALDFQWENNDVIVIGGANGLSSKDQELLDKKITIPSALPFMTTTSVIPMLTYQTLNKRGLWKYRNEKD